MGILIKQYRNGTFGVWSTNSDSYLAKFLSKNDVIDYLTKREMSIAKAMCEKIKKSFPEGYIDKDTYKIIKTPHK